MIFPFSIYAILNESSNNTSHKLFTLRTGSSSAAFFYHDGFILIKHIIFNTIGSTPGAYDVKIFETLSPQASYSVSHTVDSTTYPAPYKFYTTVRCYNTIGLFT